MGSLIRLLATIQNVGGGPLELVMPCGHYIELYVTSAAGVLVYDWTAEQYPPRPGQPQAPPCPRQTRTLGPGEGLQATFGFAAPAPGPQTIHLTRFGGPGPVATLEIQVALRP